MKRLPTITVVIPTVGRTELFSAVESVLQQTIEPHEVIIGADTLERLNLPDDPRVQVVRTGPRAGGNVARMAAIDAATGDLIALLDDDDLWEKNKLEQQLAAVESAAPKDGNWVSSSLVREPNGRIWPERVHQIGERIPHYLFRKTHVRAGQGAMHTSTLLFPRNLVEEIPFDTALRFHQDTDWLIRLDKERPEATVIQVLEPLAQLREGEASVSLGITGQKSLAWARRSMNHLDRRTRSDFLMTVTYFQACRHLDLQSAAHVVCAALFWGRLGLKTLPSLATVPLKAIWRRRS